VPAVRGAGKQVQPRVMAWFARTLEWTREQAAPRVPEAATRQTSYGAMGKRETC